MKQVDFRIG